MGFLIAQGEAINGSIYSYDKKLPIIEANISVKGSDLGTTTDEKGEFFIELDIINNIALLISMMGYQDTTIIITNNQNSSFGRIYLKPLVIELNQIHVDSHKDIYQSKSPSSISVFGNKFQNDLHNVGKPLLEEITENFIIFSSSKSSQVSATIKEAEHGIFSYYLMKGLEGKADNNKDKKITNGELLAYMDENVSQKASELGRQQNPSLSGDPDQVLMKY